MDQLIIVSGGQTGADRGGLEAAIEMDVPHRGWCPKGRQAEDGIIPHAFCLTECKSKDYLARTELNVADSDATIIFVLGKLSGGSHRTAGFCTRQNKPYLILNLGEMNNTSAVTLVVDFIRGSAPRSLNVAGNRESKAPGIQQRVRNIMMQVLGKL